MVSLSIVFAGLTGCTSKKYDGAYFEREYKNQKPVSKDVTTSIRKPQQSGAAIVSGGPEIVLAKKRFADIDEDPALVAEYEAKRVKQPDPVPEKKEESNQGRRDASIYANGNYKPKKTVSKSNLRLSEASKKSVSAVSSSIKAESHSSVVASSLTSSSSSSSANSSIRSTQSSSVSSSSSSSVLTSSASSSKSSIRSLLPLGAQSVNSFDPRNK